MIIYFYIKIIDQCGHIRIRRETLSIDQKFDDQHSKTLSLSILDRQLIYINRSLHAYRSFWLKLPEQICKSTGISALNGSTCWTGTSISQDGRYEIISKLVFVCIFMKLDHLFDHIMINH
jgi:hypothetical protein